MYGDWGTSKAYVIGIAVALAGAASFYFLLGVVALTLVVGVNYIFVCRYFPGGGGVYQSAKAHSSRLAVVGALLLLADYIVTAALSCLEAFHYFGVHDPKRFAVIAIFGLGILNYFGPRFTGRIAIYLAIPSVATVIVLICGGFLSEPQFNIQPPTGGIGAHWHTFVSLILALSGVEAIANMTGVLQLDPNSTEGKPSVHRSSKRAIIIVMIEVCVATALLGLLSSAVENPKTEDMLRVMGTQFLGPTFGYVVGIVFGLLLLSAVNTALGAMVAVLYSMAQDREFPPVFRELNRYGVPWVPLITAVAVPVVVLELFEGVETLASLYAIGVVGAITLDLGSTVTNRSLGMSRKVRWGMGATAVLMGLIWVTIAVTKLHALVFVTVLLVAGLCVREVQQRTARRLPADVGVKPLMDAEAPEPPAPRKAAAPPILVSVRGPTAAFQFAWEQAKLSHARLYILYIREVAVALDPGLTAGPDPYAERFFAKIRERSQEEGIDCHLLYRLGNDPAQMIVDAVKELQVPTLVMGVTRRSSWLNLIKGNVIADVATALPSEVRLLVVG